MPRARRTSFAAPFVIVAGAAACSHDKPGTKPPDHRQTWSVHRDGDQCSADMDIKCPPPDVATCNPPAPMMMPCPPDIADGDSFRVVALAGGRCVIEGSETAVTCPSYDAPPPPTPIDAAQAAFVGRRWDVHHNADGTCWAADDPCSRMKLAPGEPMPPCNPPPPITIACPDASVVAIVERAKDECETESKADCDPGVKCNPPGPQPIDCPHY